METKFTKRDVVYKLVEFNPEITNTQIVTVTGYSRQLISYHRSRMKLPNRSPNRVCENCHKRISRYNMYGLCKECRPLSFTYEYKCAQCGAINLDWGHKAATRRYTKKNKKNPDLDFCNSKCSATYFFNRPKV